MSFERLDHRTLGVATGIAASMGVVWLLLEYMLRGGRGDVGIDLPKVAAGGIGGLFVGLAIRARTSMAGDFRVNVELMRVVILAVSLLPAAMLIVYAVAFVLSTGFVVLAWGLWSVCLALAWVLQVVIWVGVLAAAGAAARAAEDDKKAPAFGVVVCAYAGAVSLAGKAVGGTYVSAWDCSLPNWVLGLNSRIPSWTFIVDALRRALSGMEHSRLISLLATVAVGLVAALVAALLIRWVRQLMMTRATWRPYLPMAAAPVPDGVPMLSQGMLLPVIVFLFGVWTVIMMFQVL